MGQVGSGPINLTHVQLWLSLGLVVCWLVSQIIQEVIYKFVYFWHGSVHLIRCIWIRDVLLFNIAQVGIVNTCMLCYELVPLSSLCTLTLVEVYTRSI